MIRDTRLRAVDWLLCVEHVAGVRAPRVHLVRVLCRPLLDRLLQLDGLELQRGGTVNVTILSIPHIVFETDQRFSAIFWQKLNSLNQHIKKYQYKIMIIGNGNRIIGMCFICKFL